MHRQCSPLLGQAASALLQKPAVLVAGDSQSEVQQVGYGPAAVLQAGAQRCAGQAGRSQH